MRDIGVGTIRSVLSIGAFIFAAGVLILAGASSLGLGLPSLYDNARREVWTIHDGSLICLPLDLAAHRDLQQRFSRIDFALMPAAFPLSSGLRISLWIVLLPVTYLAVRLHRGGRTRIQDDAASRRVAWDRHGFELFFAAVILLWVSTGAVRLSMGKRGRSMVLDAGSVCGVPIPSALIICESPPIQFAAMRAWPVLLGLLAQRSIAQRLRRMVQNQTADSRCSFCGYDTRGLDIASRCPECGSDNSPTANRKQRNCLLYRARRAASLTVIVPVLLFGVPPAVSYGMSHLMATFVTHDTEGAPKWHDVHSQTSEPFTRLLAAMTYGCGLSMVLLAPVLLAPLVAAIALAMTTSEGKVCLAPSARSTPNVDNRNGSHSLGPRSICSVVLIGVCVIIIVAANLLAPFLWHELWAA